MVREILHTTRAMGRSPLTCMNSDCPASLVNHAVYTEAGVDHGSNSFAFFMDRVAIQEASADARAASASFKIKRQHMCRLDSARGGKSWADGFASPRKTRKVVKPDCASYDDMRKVL